MPHSQEDSPSQSSPGSPPPDSDEQATLHVPVVLFDGRCEHDYQDAYVDLEGFTCQRCSKCPMGRRLPAGS